MIDEDDDPYSWRTLEDAIERSEANHLRHAERANDPRVSLTKPETPSQGGWSLSRPHTLELVLGFEQKWPRHTGGKEDAIRTVFNLSAIRYYQVLDHLINTREALELNPMLVNRLRAQREARNTARASRSFRPSK